MALSIPLAQPLAGLTKRYAAPWETFPDTSALGAAARTASPEVATDCPNLLKVPGSDGSEVVSLAVSVSGPAQPEAGRLKTYTAPSFAAFGAPTAIVSPAIETEYPNQSKEAPSDAVSFAVSDKAPPQPDAGFTNT